MKSIKMVLIGDTAVGKSCLITNYLHNKFSDVYEPTVLDVYRGVKTVRKEQVQLEIHDTSGDDNLGTNRKVVYKNADLFLLCCSVLDKSIENCDKWKAEVREVEEDAPIFLISTKKDIRDDNPECHSQDDFN